VVPRIPQKRGQKGEKKSTAVCGVILPSEKKKKNSRLKRGEEGVSPQPLPEYCSGERKGLTWVSGSRCGCLKKEEKGGETP